MAFTNLLTAVTWSSIQLEIIEGETWFQPPTSISRKMSIHVQHWGYDIISWYYFSPRLQPCLHQQIRKSPFREGESHYIWIKDYEKQTFFFLQNSMGWRIWRHLRIRAFMHMSEILILRRIFNLVSLPFVPPPPPPPPSCCDITQFFDILF